MKSALLILFGICLSVGAHAETWHKILSCENGAVSIDVNTADRRNLQLVVHGDALLGRLYQARMISLSYGQREWLVRGYHAELRQVSPTETEPQPLGGVFYPWDFKKMIEQDWNGGAYEIEARGSDLAFKLLHFTSGQSCANVFEGECVGGVFHKTFYFDREYVFHGCTLQR